MSQTMRAANEGLGAINTGVSIPIKGYCSLTSHTRFALGPIPSGN